MLGFQGPGEFIESILVRMQSADSTDDVKSAVEDCVSAIGFTWFAYGSFVAPGRFDTPAAILTNYPDQWALRYTEARYDQVDPIVSHSIKTGYPFVWHTFDAAFRETDEQARFMDEAASFDIRAGFAVPIFSNRSQIGIFSYATSERSPEDHLTNDWRHGLALAVMYVHNAVSGIYKRDTIDASPLSARERECLSWAARGKTAWETGAILDISPRTVQFHWENARRKLNAANVRQAVATARSHLDV